MHASHFYRHDMHDHVAAFAAALVRQFGHGWLTQRQACAFLGKSKEELRELVASGALRPPARDGNRLRYDTYDLARFVLTAPRVDATGEEERAVSRLRGLTA